MALSRTTLSTAMTATDTSMVVASASGFAAGYLVRIDAEVMKIANNYASGTTIPLIRGYDGSPTLAHVVTASVVVGTGIDFSNPTQGGPDITYQTQRARTVTSYTTAGAITLPANGADAVAILNSTVALAMTLADPSKANDGDMLTIIGNGKAAHTVTYTAGLGNAGSSYDLLTFDTGGQCSVVLMAANSIWVPWPSPLSGTLTSIDVAIA